eukprot:gb/GECG01015152.1/.p1 GENE.gb/GECG01015152.1/~~gb/GECG01015152.1/.p1  ORF type:complete len:311 (+),score=42.84 gb/GECG01015152.1/:1-933(+)
MRRRMLSQYHKRQPANMQEPLSVIQDACRAGDVANLENLLRQDNLPNLNNCGSIKGDIPLIVAAKSQKVDCMDTLLTHGVHVDATDELGRTALFWAAEGGDIQSMRLLADVYGANCHYKDKSGQTALHLAAAKGNEDCVQLLIERYGVNAATEDKEGRTPLSLATRNTAKYLETVAPAANSGKIQNEVARLRVSVENTFTRQLEDKDAQIEKLTSLLERTQEDARKNSDKAATLQQDLNRKQETIEKQDSKMDGLRDSLEREQMNSAELRREVERLTQDKNNLYTELVTTRRNQSTGASSSGRYGRTGLE